MNPGDINPYRPPAVLDAPDVESTAEIVREGNAVRIPREGATLPPRCVRCNAPSALPPMSRRIYWHHPAVYLLILIAACLYVIVAVIVRKRGTVNVYLCERHAKRRRTGIAVGWGGFLLSLIGFIALVDSVPVVGLALLFTMIAAPITGIVMSQVVAPTKMDDHYAWLRVGRPFLESIGVR